ncbi:MAG: hypothetical protein Q2484_17125 [Candidatus Sedimenticola sp. (ex Thyasira tokunagai)]
MKKCDRERVLYFERIVWKREKRKIKRKKSIEKTKRYKLGYDKIIGTPVVFSLLSDKRRVKFLRFSERLRAVLSLKNSSILIDFSSTTSMYSDATLIFRAHLCRLVNNCSNNKIRIKLSRSNKINQVLKQIGALDLLGQKPNIPTDHPDVVNWRYAQGASVVGEKYEEILGPYDGAITEKLSEGLYLGLTEAMTNTKHHAYPNTEEALHCNVESNEWWMFSQEKDGRLDVCFCDLGIGIPESLPEKKPGLWQSIMSKLGETITDGNIIEEAIQYSLSRTGHEYRGKGLKQLTSVLTNTEGGHLILHSNRGCYFHENGKTQIYNYSDSVGGTLISWSLPIASEGHTNEYTITKNFRRI